MGSLRNRKLRNRVVKQRSPTDQQSWSLAHFPVTDDNINTISQRFIKKPMDCVVNAMQVIGIVDSRSADIMRIFVGEKGIQENQIIAMFEYVYRRPFRFRKFDASEYQILFDGLNDDQIFPRSSAIFAGVVYLNGNRHVLIIGKNYQGELVYVDAQNPDLCNLNNIRCKASVFGDTSQIWIIETSALQTLTVEQKPEAMTDETI